MLCGKREPLSIARQAAAAASCPAAPPAWWDVVSPIVRSEATGTQKLWLPEVQARYRGLPSGRGIPGQAGSTPSCTGMRSDLHSQRWFSKLHRSESPVVGRSVGTLIGIRGRHHRVKGKPSGILQAAHTAEGCAGAVPAGKEANTTQIQQFLSLALNQRACGAVPYSPQTRQEKSASRLTALLRTAWLLGCSGAKGGDCQQRRITGSEAWGHLQFSQSSY